MLLFNLWRTSDAMSLFISNTPGRRQDVLTKHRAGACQQLDILITVDVLTVEEDYLYRFICRWGGLVFGNQSIFIVAVLLIWRSHHGSIVGLICGFLRMLLRQSDLIDCLLLPANGFLWQLILLFHTLLQILFLNLLTLLALLAFLAMAAIR